MYANYCAHVLSSSILIGLTHLSTLCHRSDFNCLFSLDYRQITIVFFSNQFNLYSINLVTFLCLHSYFTVHSYSTQNSELKTKYKNKNSIRKWKYSKNANMKYICRTCAAFHLDLIFRIVMIFSLDSGFTSGLVRTAPIHMDKSGFYLGM